jgi:hypothetical protein
MVKKRKPKSKNYFTEETEAYIVLYNNTPDSQERSKIYENFIHYPFFKLTQNIIHTFKFYHTEVEDLEHLQHEIIIFLLSKIHRFDPNNGAKAYSYFGTIVKRWLILYNKKNYSKKIHKVDAGELDGEGTTHFISPPEDDNTDLGKYIDLYVNYCSQHLFDLFPKKNDAQIADAILEIFRNRENLEMNLDKKTLYIYIREIMDVKTPKITKISNQLYDIFKTNYIFYLENGYVKF